MLWKEHLLIFETFCLCWYFLVNETGKCATRCYESRCRRLQAFHQYKQTKAVISTIQQKGYSELAVFYWFVHVSSSLKQINFVPSKKTQWFSGNFYKTRFLSQVSLIAHQCKHVNIVIFFMSFIHIHLVNILGAYDCIETVVGGETHINIICHLEIALFVEATTMSNSIFIHTYI